ncbi:hypothetical protein [Lagierella sp.]|uniref:hypothetical protein n=1 Tax=Lagierella sp. TaxID=2849657 RepID=UPI002626C98B|nr:hypothetical protein [Lagierella sp.]
MIELIDIITFIISMIIPQNPEVVDFVSGLSFLFFDVNIIVLVFLIPNIIKIFKESEMDIGLIRIRYRDDKRMYKRFCRNNILKALRIVIVALIGFSIGFLLYSTIGKQLNFGLLNPVEFQIFTPVAIFYFTVGLIFLLNVIKILLVQVSKIRANIIITLAILYSYVVIGLRIFQPVFYYFITIFDFLILPLQTPIKIVLSLVIQGVFYYYFLNHRAMRKKSLLGLIKWKVIFKTTVIALIVTTIFILFDMSIYKKVGYLDWEQFDMNYFLRGYGKGYLILADYARYLLQYITPIFIIGYVMTEISSINLNFLNIRIGSKKKIFRDFVLISLLIIVVYIGILLLLSTTFFVIRGSKIGFLNIGLFVLEEIFITFLFLTIFVTTKNTTLSFLILSLLYLTNAFDMKISSIFGFSSYIRNADGFNNVIPIGISLVTIGMIIFLFVKGSEFLWRD